jgi:AcrR family transcriptional regulator
MGGMSTESRPYKSALRAEQREQTRRRLLEAFAAILEAGQQEITLPQVARQAGVSPATAYKHFATLEALVDAYWNQPGMNMVPPTLEDRAALMRLPRQLFERFEGAENLMSVIDKLGARSPAHVRGRRNRTEQLVPLVQRVLGDIPPETARLMPRFIRLLTGSRTWIALKQDLGVSTPEAIKLVAWTLALLQSELDRNPRSFEDFDAP